MRIRYDSRRMLSSTLMYLLLALAIFLSIRTFGILPDPLFWPILLLTAGMGLNDLAREMAGKWRR